MTPRVFSLIGVLIIALVMAVSSFVGGRPQPSPSTSAPPSDSAPTAAPAAVPQALVGEWAGPPRTFGSTPSLVVRGLMSSASEWTVAGSTTISSDIRFLDPGRDKGRFTLTTGLTGGLCHAGDVGTYSYQLSAGKKRLTLTVDADPCLDRITATQGSWVRNECRTTTAIAGGDMDCYGPLEAGTYESREVNLRFDISKGDVAPITYGALKFTVPDGWTHVADNATRFWMMPTSEYPRVHDNVALDGLYVYGHPQASSRAVGCPYEPQKGVGLTPAALMAEFTGRPSLDATRAQPVTINGRSGLSTDISLAPGWTKPCDWSSGAPAAPILYANTGLSGVDAQSRERLIVLDIGRGDAVAIEIFSADASRFDALLASAMPIVESMVFAEPAAN